MKLNEFKPALTEGTKLNSWIGDVPASALKGFFSGKGTKQQMMQDLFIKDFTDDAFVSLQNGISNGLVSADVDSEAERKKAQRRKAAAARKKKPASVGAAPAAAPTAPQAAPAAAAPKVTPESAFNHLDAIFESILNEAGPTQQSISAYLTDWFNLYMAGVDWTANPTHAANVKQAILNVENVYRASKGSKGKVKSALEKLGGMAFTLAKSSPKIPAGMKDELQKLKAQAAGGQAKPAQAQPTAAPNATAPATAPAASTVNLAQVQKDIEELAKVDPQGYSNLVKKMLQSIGAAKTSP